MIWLLYRAYLKELLHFHSRDSRLRQSGRLILRQHIARKCVGEQSFVAPKLWNTLPEELRAAQSLIVSKRQLKGLAQAKIIKKLVILFWLLNMTI